MKKWLRGLWDSPGEPKTREAESKSNHEPVPIASGPGWGCYESDVPPPVPDRVWIAERDREEDLFPRTCWCKETMSGILYGPEGFVVRPKYCPSCGIRFVAHTHTKVIQCRPAPVPND
jgi:hypothetical protein